MNIDDMISGVARDIQRQAERLVLYQEMREFFNDLPINDDTYVYLCKYSDGEIYVEFSPNTQAENGKDLRPLIHAICQKFGAEFKKTVNWDGVSLVYESRFNHQLSKNDEPTNFRVQVSGVVPSTCRVEELVVPLSEDEIEALRLEALSKIQTTRTERKIICD